jgi:hypothetical protein
MLAAMKLECLAVFALCAPELTCQGLQFGATGTLAVSYQPVGSPVVNHTAPVSGATTLSIPTVGSASVTTAAVSELTITALSPPFGCSGCWSSAGGNVVVTYASATPVAGILRLTLAPQCLMGMPTIDVNDDGSIELAGQNLTQTVDVPVVLGSDPMPIRLAAQTVNFGGVSCSYAARVEFLPQPANLGTVNPSCGPTVGAALTGTAPMRQLRLRFGSMAGQIGAMFVGGTASPQTSCGPATVPAASLFLVPSPNGVEFVIPVSQALVGAYTLQYVELMANNQIVYSNAVTALLP